MGAPLWLKELATIAGARVDRYPWAPPVSAGLGIALAGLMLQAGADWVRWSSIAVVLLSYVPELIAAWWRKQEEEENGNALAKQILLMSDALIPLTQEVSALVGNTTVNQKRQGLKSIYEKAAGTCTLHFKERDNVRSCVFILSDDLTEITPVAHTGRRDRPGPFKSGTSRGDKAFEVLTARRPVRVDDLSDRTLPAWAGTGDGYNTFITCPIFDSTGAYGLLTVDAPTSGTFGESDEHLVELTASLVAVACAAATRVSAQP